MSDPGQKTKFAGTSRFQIIERLGSGGMGVVYAAHDRERQTRVALKTVKQPSPEALLRLKTEFRALQDLTHPNLITLDELHEVDGQWFFTMELVKGVNFLKWIRPRRRPTSEEESAPTMRRGLESVPAPSRLPGSATRPEVPEEDADAADAGAPAGPAPLPPPSLSPVPFHEQRLRDGLRQLVEGLNALHKTQRVHRDIKPSNILVTPEGRVVLLDFGLVAELEPIYGDEDELTPMGTASYMAPEQAAGQPSGPEADWYSLGVVLYRALTKELPFTGTPHEVLRHKQSTDPPRPRDRYPAIPPDLDNLCCALLSRDPAHRPTGAEILARLERRLAPAPVNRGERDGDAEDAGTSLSPTRVFVGREAELATLRGALQETRQGQLAKVLVHGPSGLGKTELLQSFVRELKIEEVPPAVLMGRCYEQEAVPFKAFDGVVDALSRLLLRLPKEEQYRMTPRDAALLISVFPVLGRVEALASAPRPRQQLPDPQDRRGRAFAALREIFSCLADQYTLVVLIDDLHWADTDSLLLLKALLQPGEAPPMLLLTALRTVPEGFAELDPEPATSRRAPMLGLPEIRAIFPEPPVEIPVRPLPEDQARALTYQLLSTTPDQAEEETGARVEQIIREAAGHPLFIRELVRHVGRTGDASQEETRLEDAIWNRLASLETELNEVLELVCVAGVPIRQDRLAEAAGRDAGGLARPVARLRIAHLVRTRGARVRDRVEPYHDRIRQAVLKRLSSERRREIYDRLAGALLASPEAEPEQVATFLEGAGKPTLAARYVAEAAEQAAEAMAFDRAARLYERAIALQPEPTSAEEREEQRQLWFQLAEARANAGRGPQAADAYIRATQQAPAAEALDLKRRAAGQLLRCGHVDAGMQVTREVLESLNMRWPGTPVAALASLLWRRLVLKLRGLRFKERDASLIEAERLLRVDMCFALSTGLAVADHIRGLDFSSRFVRYALDSGEPGRVLRALCIEANFAAAGGRKQARYLRRIMRAAEELLRRHDDSSVYGYLDGARAFAAMMSGRWRQALEHAEQAERNMLEYGTMSWERATTRFVILWSYYYLGQWKSLRARAFPLVEEAIDRGDRYAAAGYLLGRNNIAWVNAEGPDSARVRIREMLGAWTTQGYHLQHYYALTSDVHLDLYEGAPRSAYQRVVDVWRTLKRSFLMVMPSLRLEVLHMRARCCVAVALEAPPSERPALLKEARRFSKKLDRRRAGWTDGLSDLVRAAVLAQQGQTDLAVETLGDAVEALDQHELGMYAAVARIRLADLIQGDRGHSLRQQALEFMAAQEVAAPDRMVAIYAPGFPEGT